MLPCPYRIAYPLYVHIRRPLPFCFAYLEFCMFYYRRLQKKQSTYFICIQISLTCVKFNATNHSNLTAIDNSEKFNNNEKICVTFHSSEDSQFKLFHFKTCVEIDIFPLKFFLSHVVLSITAKWFFEVTLECKYHFCN